MSILLARPAAAKFSTLAPTRRARRPFGEGLLVDEAPAPVSRLTDYFAAKVERGISPNGEIGAIPAGVQFIRITSGTSEGTYRRAEDPHGRREWEITSNGTRRRLAGVCADEAYAAGRVAILDKAATVCPSDPVRPATTRPEPFIPTFGDCAEILGFELGIQGIDAAPCKSWLPAIKDRFAVGLGRGRAALRDLEAEEARRQAWEDEMEVEALGLELDPHERAEAGMTPLPGVTMD